MPGHWLKLIAAGHLPRPTSGTPQALEAVQAQAGHRSIESTRIYLHLSAGWLATEYTNALAAIDAQSTGTPSAGAR